MAVLLADIVEADHARGETLNRSGGALISGTAATPAGIDRHVARGERRFNNARERLMTMNRRAALVGGATLAFAGRALAQQGLSQAGTSAVAASRAEHTKLAAACDPQFVGLPAPTALRSEVGAHPCQGIYWTPKGQ